jgi:hypothetical protein
MKSSASAVDGESVMNASVKRIEPTNPMSIAQLRYKPS